MTWSKRTQSTVHCDVAGCFRADSGWGVVGVVRKDLKRLGWRNASIEGASVDVCPKHPEPMYVLVHNNALKEVRDP